MPSHRRHRTIAESLIVTATASQGTSRSGDPPESRNRIAITSHWEDITMELTRRHALAGAAALAAAPLLPQSPANAAAPVADKQAPSFYRYKVGDIQVTVISDGVNTFALARKLRPQREEGRSQRRARKGLHAEGQDEHPVRAAGHQYRRQAGRDRHRQRPGARSHRARALSASSPATWPRPASIPRRSTWW